MDNDAAQPRFSWPGCTIRGAWRWKTIRAFLMLSSGENARQPNESLCGLYHMDKKKDSPGETSGMKNNFSNIHPELQQAAKISPKFNFSKKNLWLIYLLMYLTPSPKTPEDILIKNVAIPGQADRTKIRLRIYQPKSFAAPTPSRAASVAANI